MQRVSVWRGDHKGPLFGPLPGVRLDTTLAYEFQLPASFVPWPGSTLLERVYVLLDLGVSMSCPVWQFGPGADRTKAGPDTWYVDLVHVTDSGDTVTVRDLYIDVMVPTDGRHQRLLDLEEYADAIEAGDLDVPTAIDGMRRWQAFLDRHLHSDRDPTDQWTDFPPRRLAPLAALPTPLGPIVTAPG